MNDTKHPCNCPPLEGIPAMGTQPRLSRVQSARAIAKLTSSLPAPGVNFALGSGHLTPPPMALPSGEPLPIAGGIGVAGLEALLAVAKRNPGLKITLSY